MLGAPAAIGRTFSGPGDRSSNDRLAVLSFTAWQDLFGSDTTVAGRPLRINGQPYILSGVMPRGFSWPEGTKVWLLAPGPVPPSPVDVKDALTNRDVHYFEAVARLRRDVSLTKAQQDVHLVAAALQHDYPQSSSGRDLRLVPLRDDLTGDIRPALLVIQGAVGLVLLIACANVSSLLIARATGRRRELAIRAALGAGRGHLLRQLLTESLLIGAAGGVLGLLLASWLILFLVKLIPEGLPRADAIGLDGTVTTVCLVASLATGMLFGILPALQASRARAAAAMKESGERGSARARGRSVLVIAEIALTLVLLVAAGLLAGSFLRLARVDSGFRTAQVTVADLFVPQTRYPKAADMIGLYRRLVDALSQRPEFQAAGIGFPGPLHGNSASGVFLLEGRQSASRADRPFAHLGIVSGGYFAAMGIPLLSGRTFTQADAAETAAPVAMVSTALAKRYWPGDNPVGKRLRFDATASDPWFTIVGMVADTRQLGLSEDAPALLYLPYGQFPLPFTSIAVRSDAPESAVVGALRAQLTSVDPDLSFGDTSSLQTIVDRSIGQPRFRAMLIGTFALLALLLAAVGVYGLISYSVTQRTREIGIRVALGAAPRQVLGAIVREGLLLAAIGIGLGLAAALLVMHTLSAFLFGVGASDPLTLAGVSLVLLIVAAAASYIPSRRALRIDPIQALRTE